MDKWTREKLEPIAATDAKMHFGEVLHQTSINNKRYLVNRQGKPVSVILSYREYCDLIKASGEKEYSDPEGL